MSKVPAHRATKDREDVPTRVVVPPPPTYSDNDPGDRTLRDEQQVARVEILMTKGVREKAQLMTLLGIEDFRQITRYMERVYARWELYGGHQDLARQRGETLNRLDLIEQELWQRVNNNNDSDPRVALVALNNLTQLSAQRTSLLGLTPKVIERMNSQDAGDSIAFARRITGHEKMARVVARMAEMLEERTAGLKVIEQDDTAPDV